MGILSGIMDWFNFKKMLTPFIIKLMYVLGHEIGGHPL